MCQLGQLVGDIFSISCSWLLSDIEISAFNCEFFKLLLAFFYQLFYIYLEVCLNFSVLLEIYCFNIVNWPYFIPENHCFLRKRVIMILLESLWLFFWLELVCYFFFCFLLASICILLFKVHFVLVTYIILAFNLGV